MRRVERSAHSPSAKWLQDADALKPLTRPQTFKDHYAHQEVHQALAELFRRKCAYCEAIDNNLEIEHFRPKGQVMEEPTHPGYYWLAYDWPNLFPACSACNRRLRDRGASPAQGKAEQFPLRAGSPRAFTPADDLSLEQRLLLDPCEDEPNQHLRLLPTGKMEGLTDMGSTSITVYHLTQSTKEYRRKGALQRLLRAHKAGNVEELRIILGDDGEFCGLLRAYYSDLVARDWRDQLNVSGPPDSTG